MISRETPPGLVSVVDDRLAELGLRYGLGPAATTALSAALAHQAADDHASTTVREPAAAVDRHVADSLVALDLPEVRAARRIADLGSGAGWPGLALAAALPRATVTLVESASRRCRYLERVVAAAGLANVTVVHARAEAWPEGIGVHDLVTARALAALPVLCEYAAPLLALGGALVAWKGTVQEEEERAGAAAAAELGLVAAGERAVDPYPGAGPAVLHVFRKVASTPARFPRRPGVAAKRPLGS
jgi:16S rRNA (guanine527-N7)-methyltransferase